MSHHVTNVQLPLILMDVLVCCGLKMVLFRCIYKTLTTSNNPLTVLQLVEELETFISFSLSSASVIYDLITNDRFPSAQTCEESRILYRCLIFSLLYGGFATTILRMLFITRPNLVQRFDKKNIAIAVLLFWQLCLITTIIAITKYVKLIPVLFLPVCLF